MAHSPSGYIPPENRTLKVGANCLFYRNGDNKKTASKVVISDRIRNLEGVKDELTRKFNSKDSTKTGYVRNVYTPIHGTPVTRLEDFKNGAYYVAALNNEKFVSLNYTDIKDERRRESRKAASSDMKTYTPVQHQHDPRLRNLHGRAKSLGEQKRAIILKVFLNGEFTDHARTVLITEPSKRSLKYLKEYIQDTLGTSEIRELYRVVNDGGRPENFSLITENDVTNLRNNEHILAVQNIRHLTPKRYNEKGCRNFTVHTSPRTGQASLYDPFPMPHSPPRNKGQFSKHKKLPGIGSSNQSQADTMSPYSNAPSHGGRRSDKSKGSRNNRDYDTDEGGVFKAKRQNNAQGAHQVNDTRETRTEKPIDQREAEVVDEEEVHTKEKTTPIPPGTELNKRPSKEDKQNSDNVSQSKNKNEERVNEDAAAAKIQAGARAYKARKEYQAKKQAKQLDEEARHREQDALRQQEEECREEEERQRAEQNSMRKQMDEDKAATKIQASFKGHKARKDFKARQATKQQGQQ